MTDEPELLNLPPGHQVTWFNPARPVNGGTVNVHPEPPNDWPPASWGPYVALRLFAKSLVALDEPTMAEARRSTSLDDVIRRARTALATRDEENDHA